MKRLTGKTCILLLALSLTVSLFAYGCIWLCLPYMNQNQAQRRLDEKTALLVEQLKESGKTESIALLVEFIRETGAYTLLTDDSGNQALPAPADMDDAGGETAQASGSAGIRTDYGAVDRKLPERTWPFRSADGTEYMLVIRQDMSGQQETVRAMLMSLPFVAVITVVLSAVCAWIFSRYATAPVLRMNRIAGKMAQLDFSWYCPDERDDEIGMLSASINKLSDKLHSALEELRQRNDSLEDEIRLEKERERRQMLFFSGVSHELRTPLAVLAGQLEGMLAGIGVYRDRETWLARSLEILRSLNRFVKEILLISHMDMKCPEASMKTCLSDLVRDLVEEYEGYAEFYGAVIEQETEQGLFVTGQEQMLKKALGNVTANAIIYSGEGGFVKVKLCSGEKGIVFTVTNTPAHIALEHLPHVFEAFYRTGTSERAGSGLGLYITGLILDHCGGSYQLENTETGVKFTAVFQGK